MLLVHIWVPGDPKTKGSMEHIGNGQMRESVAGSKEWRKAIATRAGADVARRFPDGPIAAMQGGPVRVEFSAFLPDRPTANRSGDVDKLARNVLDALQDAGVYADDTQVVSLIGWEFWATALGRPTGMIISAYAMDQIEITRLERIARVDFDQLAGFAGRDAPTLWG